MGSLATNSAYRGLKQTYQSPEEFARDCADIVNRTLNGKLNAVTTLTLAANVASTTLTDSRIGPNSYIGLMPTTANAATALGTAYITGRDDGSCVVNHANNAQTDRSFVLLIIG